MSKYLRIFSIIAGLAISVCLPTKAHAILGGQIFSNGGTVSVEVLDPDALFVSELFLFSPDPDQFIALSTDVGTVVNLGPFNAGDELLFGIHVQDTGDTFYMGPASRNFDNAIHADVVLISAGVYEVGFEDFEGGGDDYNDVRFRFSGDISTEVVPEPASLLLLGSGLAGAFLRRKKA